jgi:hypothetical protein
MLTNREKEEKIKNLRSKSSGYNISNLYDLASQLSSYINELDSLSLKNKYIKFNNATLNFENKNETIYNIPDSIVSNTNILLSSSNNGTIINIKEQKTITMNSPSGKITLLNGNSFPGEYTKFTLENSFIKDYNNILLTINKFEPNNSIPVCICESITSGSCNICIYNAGTSDLTTTYDIVFLVI